MEARAFAQCNGERTREATRRATRGEAGGLLFALAFLRVALPVGKIARYLPRTSRISQSDQFCEFAIDYPDYRIDDATRCEIKSLGDCPNEMRYLSEGNLRRGVSRDVDIFYQFRITRIVSPLERIPRVTKRRRDVSLKTRICSLARGYGLIAKIAPRAREWKRRVNGRAAGARVVLIKPLGAAERGYERAARRFDPAPLLPSRSLARSLAQLRLLRLLN